MGGELKAWTNTYFVGAVWGTSLIVAAIVAFVPLVSLQAPHEWPISGLGVGSGAHSDASNADQSGAIVSVGRHAAPNLNVPPNAGPNVAANGATDTPAGSTGASGKRRQVGETRGGGTGSLANQVPAVSPASAEGPVAANPGSHSPAGPGAVPATGQSETGGSSDLAMGAENPRPGRADKTPGSLPITTTAVIRSLGSSPPLAGEGTVASASAQDSSTDGGGSSGSETKGQSDQIHGTSGATSPPPASAAAVHRNPEPGPSGRSLSRLAD